MKREIDVQQPFIAIRQDVDGDRYQPTMGEYLCNPLAESLLDVRISTDGFFSDDTLGVVESLPNHKPPFDVPAGAAIRFALSTEDEYDEMVVSWSVRYRSATGDVVRASFGSFKRLEDTEYFEQVPILGQSGFVVPRTVA